MLIVTGSDNNYVPGVLVLIASVAFHNPDAEFAVLGMNIDSDNQDRIRRLGEKLDIKIKLIDIQDDHFDRYIVRRSYLTRGAFLRLLIPELFPDLDRAIYMDCDMVAIGDLSELETVDLGDAPVGAVPCPAPMEPDLLSVGAAKGEYFNSGLLVMNIPVWNQLKVSERCAELLSDPDRHLYSEDQSALNIVCRNNVLLLPSAYNVYSTISAYDTLEEFPTHPVVIHFVVNSKPWKSLATFGGIWKFHADRIADLMPPHGSTSLKQKFSGLNFWRKTVTEGMSRKPKYKIRHQLRKLVNSGIIAPYIAQHRSS